MTEACLLCAERSSSWDGVDTGWRRPDMILRSTWNSQLPELECSASKLRPRRIHVQRAKADAGAIRPTGEIVVGRIPGVALGGGPREDVGDGHHVTTTWESGDERNVVRYLNK